MQSKLLSRVMFNTDNECWEWAGTFTRDGYGRFTIFPNGRKPKYVSAHRLSYEAFRGSIQNKWVLHRCDNKKCINPEHLFLGTNTDNMRDMCIKKRDKNSKKTHCSRGHDFKETVYLDGMGRRQCRICQRIRSKESYYRVKHTS